MNLLHKLTLLFLLPISISAAEQAEIAAMRAKIKASIHQNRASGMLKQAHEQVQYMIPSEKLEYQKSQRTYRQDLIQECWPSIVVQQARLELLRSRSERFSSLERITRKQRFADPLVLPALTRRPRFADPLLPRLARLHASAMRLTLPVEEVQAICCNINRIAIAEYPKLPPRLAWDNPWEPMHQPKKRCSLRDAETTRRSLHHFLRRKQAIGDLPNQEIGSSLDEMIGHAQIKLASSSSEEDESYSSQEID